MWIFTWFPNISIWFFHFNLHSISLNKKNCLYKLEETRKLLLCTFGKIKWIPPVFGWSSWLDKFSDNLLVSTLSVSVPVLGEILWPQCFIRKILGFSRCGPYELWWNTKVSMNFILMHKDRTPPPLYMQLFWVSIRLKNPSASLE